MDFKTRRGDWKELVKCDTTYYKNKTPLRMQLQTWVSKWKPINYSRRYHDLNSATPR